MTRLTNQARREKSQARRDKNRERREMTLRALAGENRYELGREYGVSRSWIYAEMEEAREDPEGRLAEAEEEREYRERALEIESKRRALDAMEKTFIDSQNSPQIP